jgi:UDP-GlcNAc:undecaprenyl-phosphate GlcNAc-1-phosphate transferase
VIGLIDDVLGLNPLVRLLGAVVAGVLLVTLGDSSFEVGVAVFWVIAVVVVVNAINLFDGLDALAGSVGTVAIVGMAWFGATQGGTDPWIVLAIAGALIGFLFWNRPPARLYLGDNGAYVVGLLSVWAAMWASTDRMGGVIAVALVGIPLIDLGVTVFRRGLAGTPFFSGDRDHTYDRLRQQGLSDAGVAAILTVAQVVWVAVLVGASVFWGDLVAAIIGLVLGLVLAFVLGVRSTLVEG